MMKKTMPFFDNPERRFFSRDDCERLSRQAMDMAHGGGKTTVTILSGWDANLNWSRNRISIMSDVRSTEVRIVRVVNGTSGYGKTNQIDAASLRAAIEVAETTARMNKARPPRVGSRYPGNDPLTPNIWDDATAQQSGDERGEIVGHVIGHAESEGVVSAGFAQAGIRTQAIIDSEERELYYAARTVTQFSTTMRDWKQRASGWAGASSYSWGRFDPMVISTRAIEKCIQSRNPVAVEPGRYLTILEPQATGQVLGSLFFPPMRNIRSTNETSERFPWFERNVSEPYNEHTLRYGLSKLGKRVLDSKVSVRQLPMHPELGTWPYALPRHDDPYQEVTWVERGVLMNIPDNRTYVSDQLSRLGGLLDNSTLAMDGGDSSIEEMIETTKRGILVTRFSRREISGSQGKLEDYTRDGLWLIENGKISKAIKNFRVLDSAYFILNDVLTVGPAVPIFSPENPIIVPPIKVREVNFVSLADAV